MTPHVLYDVGCNRTHVLYRRSTHAKDGDLEPGAWSWIFEASVATARRAAEGDDLVEPLLERREQTALRELRAPPRDSQA